MAAAPVIKSVAKGALAALLGAGLQGGVGVASGYLAYALGLITLGVLFSPDVRRYVDPSPSDRPGRRLVDAASS